MLIESLNDLPFLHPYTGGISMKGGERPKGQTRNRSTGSSNTSFTSPGQTVLLRRNDVVLSHFDKWRTSGTPEVSVLLRVFGSDSNPSLVVSTPDGCPLPVLRGKPKGSPTKNVVRTKTGVTQGPGQKDRKTTNTGSLSQDLPSRLFLRTDDFD